VDSNEIEGDGDSMYNRVAAAAPHIVAFESRAANLLGAGVDTNGFLDVFVRDLNTTDTTRVSVSTIGGEGNEDTWLSEISDDGRWVLMLSYADNLVIPDTNGERDALLHDRVTGETTIISVNSAGDQANKPSWLSSITPDGRYVVFLSGGTNLVAGDTNGVPDAFVHDRDVDDDGIFDEPGAILTTRVSVASGGSQANGRCADGTGRAPQMSADGRYVLFSSQATNLVSFDFNVAWDVFIHDRQTGQTVRVSVSSAGAEGDNHSRHADITPDGRFVIFRSGATNLVPGDTNGVRDVFLHDRDADDDGIYDEPGAILTTRVSVNSDGVENNGGGGVASSISADGRFVSFNSPASNLVPNDFNYWIDVFLHDTSNGETTLVSAGLGGIADERSFWSSMSADARYVSYHSYATDIVDGDTNDARDVFQCDRNEITPPCPADIDGGGDVGVTDFLALLAAWGPCPDPCPPCPADLDGDCIVGVTDFLILLANWGPCP
jgi:Tol biopolymer transport system component